MPDLRSAGGLIVVALVGSLVGGVAGFGTGIIMLAARRVGDRHSFGGPVLTVAMLVGNLSRIGEPRRGRSRVVVRFALGAVPATALAQPSSPECGE